MPLQFLLEIRENKKNMMGWGQWGEGDKQWPQCKQTENDEINQNATQSTNTGSLDWKQSKKQHQVPPLGSKSSSTSFSVSGIAE